MPQFLKFGAVGAIGFAVDTGVLAVLVYVLNFNPYGAKVASFFAAATVTYMCNSLYTFRLAPPSVREWARFLVLGAGTSGLATYVIYSVLVAIKIQPLSEPVVAVAPASIVGWGLNFLLSRRFVFQPR